MKLYHVFPESVYDSVNARGLLSWERIYELTGEEPCHKFEPNMYGERCDLGLVTFFEEIEDAHEFVSVIFGGSGCVIAVCEVPEYELRKSFEGYWCVGTQLDRSHIVEMIEV